MPTYRFLKVYLVIALVIALLGIADSILLFLNIDLPFYSLVLSLLAVLFFFFNLLAIFIFYHQSLDRIAYVLPVYHLISFLIFGGMGIIMGTALINSISIYLLLSGFLTSLFEFGFSVYMLVRFMQKEAKENVE